MHDSLKFWLWALFALFCFWLMTGGYNSNLATGGPYIRSYSLTPYGQISNFSLIPSGNFSFGKPSPTDSIKNANDPESIQREIDRVSSEIKKAQDATVASEYKGKFSIRSRNSSGTDPGREYLEVAVSPDLIGKVLITGWQVRSAITGKSTTIGKGIPLVFTDQVNQEDPIFVTANQTIYITTGRSPISHSFRTNLCTGYFGQFQDYTPSLRNECPRPSDEKLPVAPNNFSDACLDYLEWMSTCRIQTQPLPDTLEPSCKTFISEKVTYPACVQNHKNDRGFFKPEWRIFLGQSTRFWKDRREVIQLIDLKGKVVDTFSY